MNGRGVGHNRKKGKRSRRQAFLGEGPRYRWSEEIELYRHDQNILHTHMKFSKNRKNV